MVTAARVALIRHGESEYNESLKVNGIDPLVRDASLTAEGRKQATSTRRFLEGKTIDLVITSPLTRAIQTCLIVFPPEAAEHLRYEVWPECREVLEASCDIGSAPAELCSKFNEHTAALNFSTLPTTWWTVPNEISALTPDEQLQKFKTKKFVEPEEQYRSRVDAFLYKLRRCARPDMEIAVFGHADFFHELLLRHFREDCWMENCEVHEVELCLSEAEAEEEEEEGERTKVNNEADCF